MEGKKETGHFLIGVLLAFLSIPVCALFIFQQPLGFISFFSALEFLSGFQI